MDQVIKDKSHLGVHSHNDLKRSDVLLSEDRRSTGFVKGVKNVRKRLSYEFWEI